MKVAIVSDHRGVDIKKALYEYLIGKNIDAIDLSPENHPTDDYPDFVYRVGKAIQDKSADLGILVCRSGIGMSIAANKMKGIYCGRVTSKRDIVLTCHDNGINVVSLSMEDVDLEEAKEIVDIFLTEERLNDERHVRRFKKVLAIEDGSYNEL